MHCPLAILLLCNAASSSATAAATGDARLQAGVDDGGTETLLLSSEHSSGSWAPLASPEPEPSPDPSSPTPTPAPSPGGSGGRPSGGNHPPPPPVTCDSVLLTHCGHVRGGHMGCKTCADRWGGEQGNCTTLDTHSFCTAGINPLHKQTITVYHVNPAMYGDQPVNMNTADAHGDMYFAFKTAYIPVQCHSGSSTYGLTCTNAETNAPDLVITKLVLEVDARYGQYQMCNVCVDGKDPLGNIGRRRRTQGWGSAGNRTARACSMTGGDGVPGSAVPEYVCDCHSRGGVGACDDTEVGREDIGLMFGGQRGGFGGAGRPGFNFTRPSRRRRGGGYSGRRRGGGYPVSNFTRPTSRIDTSNWDRGLARKLGGFWYSTRDAGMCTASSSWCSWRMVNATKRVSKDCWDNSIYAYVEAKDTRGCFANCPTPTNGAVRNMSDVCWVTCFFETVLGANSTHGTVNASTDGMALAELDEAWDRVFATDDLEKGGCPDLGKSLPVSPAESTGQSDLQFSDDAGQGSKTELKAGTTALRFMAVATIVLAILGAAAFVKSKLGGKLEKDDGGDRKGLSSSLLDNDFMAVDENGVGDGGSAPKGLYD
jgi:hypothetical protein